MEYSEKQDKDYKKYDENPWYIHLPDPAEDNRLVQFQGYHCPGVYGSDNLLPRLMASAIQGIDAPYAHNVMGSAFDYDGSMMVTF